MIIKIDQIVIEEVVGEVEVIEVEIVKIEVEEWVEEIEIIIYLKPIGLRRENSFVIFFVFFSV